MAFYNYSSIIPSLEKDIYFSLNSKCPASNDRKSKETTKFE